MENDTSNIIRMMQQNPVDPSEHDELATAWNRFCEKSWADAEATEQFAQIETAALTRLAEEGRTTPASDVGSDIGRILESFPHATYLVAKDGRVAAYNSAAFSQFDLKIGDGIDSLPFKLDKGERLGKFVQKTLQSKSEDNIVLLKRLRSTTNDKDSLIVVSPSAQADKLCLLFVIDSKTQANSIALLRRQFSLTDTECENLSLFIEGYSVQEIASKRCRSYETIRSQFQTLLKKTNSHSQTDLLRTTLSVSDFVRNIDIISKKVNHPHRRRAELIIDGGRIVEVTLSGDPNGEPVFNLCNAAFYTFNQEIEHLLNENNVRIISLCLPGYGNTDPVPKDEQRQLRIREDVEQVLDMLKIDQCILMTTNTSPPITFDLAVALPQRFKHVLQVAACAPFKYTKNVGSKAPWADAALKAGDKHPGIKKLLLKGGIKAWKALGAERFMRLQFAGHKHDLHFVMLPDNLEEHKDALGSATKFGVDAMTEDVSLSFEDWSSAVVACPLKITVLQGELDKVFIMSCARAMANDHKDKIALVEVKGAGFTLIYSHPMLVIEHIQRIAALSKNPIGEIQSVSLST